MNLLIQIFMDDYFQKKAAPAFLSERSRNLEANQTSADVRANEELLPLMIIID